MKISFLDFSFSTLPGQSSTMFGSLASAQDLGAIPCAISWLYKGINERRQKTGARFSVRVSALSVHATKPGTAAKDLLAAHATGMCGISIDTLSCSAPHNTDCVRVMLQSIFFIHITNNNNGKHNSFEAVRFLPLFHFCGEKNTEAFATFNVAAVAVTFLFDIECGIRTSDVFFPLTFIYSIHFALANWLVSMAFYDAINGEKREKIRYNSLCWL